MLLQTIAILLLAFTQCATGQKYELMHFTLSSYILPNKTLEMQLDVVSPRKAGTYAPILYLTGLSGLAPSFFQSIVIDSIAQNGYIFLTVSKLQSPLPDKMTKVLSVVISWIQANLQSILINRLPGVIADIDNSFMLMSHSAGGHVITQYLNDTCGKIKLQILLDPVDGVDPFGIKNQYITHPGQMLPYAVPVLVMAAELDHVGRLLQPPCASNNMSNLRFYDAMSGPKWFLNVSKYGHVDFFNNQYREVSSFVCSTCKHQCKYDQYRSYVSEMVLLFIDGVMHGNKTALSLIEQGQLSLPTEVKHNYMGYSDWKGGFCERKSKSNVRTE